MNLARIASRVAVAGTAAALATGGLVAATGTSASAAPVSTTYTCSAAGQSFQIPVSVDIALLPSTAPAGFPVPAGLLSFNSTATVPGAVQTLLTGTVNNTGAKSDDFAAAFGSTAAKAPVAWTKPAAADSNGNWVYTGKGANGAFLLPAAGSYLVKMPSTFTLVTTGGTAPVTATCTNAAPSTLGSITLSKQASVTKVKAAKKAKHGSAVAVKIKVTNDYSKTGGVVPTGKVSIKDNGKTIGKGKLKNGKVTIKVKSLSVGTHNLVVKYGGDSYTNKSKSKKLKVTITK
jgi:hypothetical protein